MSRIEQYRISEQFSLDPSTGFPEINYMVERKRGLIFGRWEAVRMFTSLEEAMTAINEELLGETEREKGQ